MTNFITHHGYDFSIETSDWTDNAAAGVAETHLENWLTALDAEATAALHADLMNFEDDATNPLARTALDAGNEAVLVATKGWARTPDTGHTCELIAE